MREDSPIPVKVVKTWGSDMTVFSWVGVFECGIPQYGNREDRQTASSEHSANLRDCHEIFLYMFQDVRGEHEIVASVIEGQGPQVDLMIDSLSADVRRLI